MTNAGVPRTLRFEILCDEIDLAAWHIKCLEALIRVPGCIPVVAVLNATPESQETLCRRLVDSIRKGSFGWSVFDRPVASRPTRATRRMSPPDWIRDLPRTECVVTVKGQYSEYFDGADIEKLSAMKLDFLTKFGFGITRGAILDSARYGVWSYHHGDEKRYRGGPPCFWEINFSNPVTGSILQRLTETLDAGVVLRRGYYQAVLHSCVKSRVQAYSDFSDWPAQVRRDILNGTAGYLDNSSPATSARSTRDQMMYG